MMIRPSVANLLLPAVILTVALQMPVPAQAQANVVNPAAKGHPRFVIAHYFAMEDPLEAARQLRRDASAAGLDAQARRENRVGESGVSAPDSVTIKHADRWTTFCTTDHRFRDGIGSLKADVDGDSMMSVFVYAEPGFSLDDIASIMETGVRVLDLRGNNVIIAAADLKKLTRISQMPRCRWIAEYSVEMKIPRRFAESPSGDYVVHSYHALQPELVEDLRRLDFTVSSVSPTATSTAIRGAFDNMHKVARLWWVKGVFASPVFDSYDSAQ